MKQDFFTAKAAVGARFCVAFFALAVSGAHAAQPGAEAAAAAADQQVVSGIHDLLAALRSFEGAAPALRPAALQQLSLLVERRREQLLVLIDQDPKRAAIRLLPGAVRQRFPASLQALLEREVRVSGTVRAAVADDMAGGHAREYFSLVDNNGQARSLSVAGAGRQELLSWVGRRASMAAVQVGDHLLVPEKGQVQLLAANGTTSQGSTQAVGTDATASVQGNQNTLVVMLNFNDKAIECTATDLQTRLFSGAGASMNQGYQQSSGGKVSFSGQVVGPFTINHSSTGTCDANAWASAANAQAAAAGVNPSSYQRVSYALPMNASCGWSGLASLGGTAPTPSWVLSCTATGLFSHELGHNLGLHHASTPTSEYGDSSDPMGSSLLVQSHGMNRSLTGWVDGNRLKDVGTGGSYAVDALENMASSNPLVLRLPKVDTGEYYYVSLRQGMDLDSGLPAAYKGALSIHRGPGALPAQSFRMANLAAGQSWTDSTNGITVTHQGLTSTGAAVGVSMGGAVCTRATPTVTVSPGSLSGAPGASLAFAVTVKNNNAAACPTSTFNVSQTLPAGFTASFASNSTALAPGASASLTWTVASPTSTADGTYTLKAVVDEAGVVNPGAAYAAYTAIAPPAVVVDTTPPVLAITSPIANSSVSGRSVTLAATASDASGVASVAFYVDGKLLVTDTSAPYSGKWTLRKVAAGSHSILVRATDTAGNIATQSISVTLK